MAQAKTKTITRRNLKSASKSKRAAKASKPTSDEQAEPKSFQDLEPSINDLQRAARLAWQLAMEEHCNGYDKDLGSLALLVTEDVDKRVGELRKLFYEAYAAYGAS